MIARSTPPGLAWSMLRAVAGPIPHAGAPGPGVAGSCGGRWRLCKKMLSRPRSLSCSRRPAWSNARCTASRALGVGALEVQLCAGRQGWYRCAPGRCAPGSGGAGRARGLSLLSCCVGCLSMARLSQLRQRLAEEAGGKVVARPPGHPAQVKCPCAPAPRLELRGRFQAEGLAWRSASWNEVVW